MSRTCAVTGATGYVGSRVARQLAASGWTIRTLGRSGADGRFDLSESATSPDLSGIGALVHLSYDFSCRGWPDIQRINVEGSRRLLDTARAAGITRTVYISSIAAFPGARSHYGRAKLAIEQMASAQGAAVVRPGLVWDREAGAMFGALARAVSALPVVPLPAPPDLRLLMTHADDLGSLVAALLDRGPAVAGEMLVAGAPETITFAQLLASLGADRGRHPRLIPLPWRLAWLGLRALELARIEPPFRSDSLLSLVAADPDPLARATIPAASLGVDFRPYPTP